MCRSIVFWLLAAWPAAGEIRDVLKSAEIDAQFARTGRSSEAHKRPNYAIVLRADQGRARESMRPDADEIWQVRKGAAALTLGGKAYQIAAGDFVYVPRSTRVRVDPQGGRLETIAVQVFPAGVEGPPSLGGFLQPRRMADVIKKAEVDETFAKFDRNQPLHSGRNFTMNYVIYQGHPGPWEAHRGCVDIYFLEIGTAAAQLGGEIAEPKEETPGEIRGTGVKGARESRVAPGDLVVIPRNTAHHMDPGSQKLGYLLLKVWAE